jgi:hypothetical protein
MRTSFRTLSRLGPWVSLAALTASLLGAAGSAQAGQGVYWSVNVGVPLHGVGRVGTTFSNMPPGVYGAAPVLIAPPVLYAPRPMYGPQPVYVLRGHGHCPPRWGWGHNHRDRGRYGWRDDRPHSRAEGYHGDHRQSWREGPPNGWYEGRHERQRYAWGDND